MFSKPWNILNNVLTCYGHRPHNYSKTWSQFQKFSCKYTQIRWHSVGVMWNDRLHWCCLFYFFRDIKYMVTLWLLSVVYSIYHQYFDFLSFFVILEYSVSMLRSFLKSLLHLYFNNFRQLSLKSNKHDQQRYSQQPHQYEAICIQYSQVKPKSWDNLATKAFGGYGFGYGYLDTSSITSQKSSRSGHSKAQGTQYVRVDKSQSTSTSSQQLQYTPHAHRR